jgi:hypothetical protein
MMYDVRFVAAPFRVRGLAMVLGIHPQAEACAYR